MRLVTFAPPGGGPGRPGWLDGDWVLDAWAARCWLATEAQGWRVDVDSRTDLVGLIAGGLGHLERLKEALDKEHPEGVAHRLADVRLLAPIPHPRTVRDFYAFEAHVKAARARRGLPMIPEWYEFPVFYFANPNAVYGPDEAVPKPAWTHELDFELEVAAVIGRSGRDIKAEDAESYIAGYMIMNDWSAREIQRAEMKVGLGPAKGKDFATSFGPWLVTPDELAARRIHGPRGGRLDLTMTARINGRVASLGNLADIHYTFAELVERASQDCTLFAGEIIGSGTVGTGCLLETGAAPWLEPGDVVELEVEGLGVLSNTVR